MNLLLVGILRETADDGRCFKGGRIRLVCSIEPGDYYLQQGLAEPSGHSDGEARCLSTPDVLMAWRSLGNHWSSVSMEGWRSWVLFVWVALA